MTPPELQVVNTQPAPVQHPVYQVVKSLPENLTPYSFITLSLIVAIICGLVSCTTVLCGCIAIAFSVQVSYDSLSLGIYSTLNTCAA